MYFIQQTIQKQQNNTGLPDNLKTRMENLSGISLDDVKAHRNSNKPAQLQAHAYAQGTNIHLGTDQEKYLPHEACRIVKQKQGWVNSTLQMKSNVVVNDDDGLEKEADVMGNRITNKNTKMISTNAQTFTKEVNRFQQLLMLRGKIIFEKSELEEAMAGIFNLLQEIST